jgi:hypothetical protein
LLFDHCCNAITPSTTATMTSHSDADNFEGLTLKDVIPNNRKPWYKNPTLVKLNTLLLCALITQIAAGYDSSMLNGMQSLPQWQKYFGQPTGTRLGAMTFAPAGGSLISVLISSQVCTSALVTPALSQSNLIPGMRAIWPSVPDLCWLNHHHHWLGHSSGCHELWHVCRVSLYGWLWPGSCQHSCSSSS